MAAQVARLLLRLDPFSNQFDIQPLTQRNNHIRHRRVHGVGTDGGGKRLVDFQHVRVKLFKPGEGAVPGTKSSMASFTPLRCSSRTMR